MVGLAQHGDQRFANGRVILDDQDAGLAGGLANLSLRACRERGSADCRGGGERQAEGEGAALPQRRGGG